MSKAAYETAFPVEIVRPVPTWQRAVAAIGSFWLRVWFILLALPLVFPHAHIGLWQVAAGLAIFTWARSDDSDAWTRLRVRR